MMSSKVAFGWSTSDLAHDQHWTLHFPLHALQSEAAVMTFSPMISTFWRHPELHLSLSCLSEQGLANVNFRT